MEVLETVEAAQEMGVKLGPWEETFLQPLVGLPPPPLSLDPPPTLLEPSPPLATNTSTTIPSIPSIQQEEGQ